MSDTDLVLRSTRVITPEGTRPASIAVCGGTIAAVLAYDAEVPAGARLEDVGDDVVLPG
ncbi:allantoinase, partial [Streptomyces tanashiensis]